MDRPLRIGVNALYLVPGAVGGTEIYLRNLLQSLAANDRENHYFIFRNRETKGDLTPSAPNFHDRPQPLNAAFRPARILYEQTMLPLEIRGLRLDVVFNPGFTAPLFCPCPMVTVFHDLQYLRHPEYFRWIDLPFWRILLPASAARSRRIVVLSQAVKRDVETFYRYPAARIDVIPHGLEPEFAAIATRRKAAPSSANTILSVSTLHPHKNLDGLLAAFRQFLDRPDRTIDWRLILVGLRGFEAPKVEALRDSLALRDRVTITGWIPRNELYDLFASAAAFIYPSKFEGFGIPVLEALACGIPTACSRLPSLVEIAGNAARFFDPENTADMVAALDQITGDNVRRAELREAGPARARAFSGDVSAKALIAVLQRAATRSKNAHD